MASSDRDGGCLLAADEIELSYGATRALRSASLRIRHGELHALVGNHSEGKTSLCRVIAGSIQPQAGRLVICGKSYGGFSLRQAAQLRIEFSSNNAKLFTHLNVADNITIGSLRGLDGYWHNPKQQSLRVSDWAAGLGIDIPLDALLSDIHPEEYDYIHLLSRLYCKPRLLILDETLESLSPTLFDNALQLIDLHVARGMSVLWVTHQLDSAIKYADTLSVLRYGAILSSGPTTDIEKKELVRRAYLDSQNELSHDGFYELLRNTEVVLRDLPLAIVIVNLQGKLRYVNNAGERFFVGGKTASMGQEAVELIGKNNESLLAEIDRARRTMIAAKPYILSLVAAMGKCLVSVQTCPVHDKGEPAGVMLVVQDVSEQEMMRRQLMLDHNLSSIGMLAAGVAHEVNNPLEVLTNYLHYFRKNPISPRTVDIVEEMRKEVGNIQKIIRNLMSFSGRSSESRNYVDIHVLAMELSLLLDFGVSQSRIHIVVHPPEQPAVIWAEAGEIRQILLNLIRNSIEAMTFGGEIVVSTVVDENRVWLTVRDNGCGIQFESFADIFLPFSSTKLNTGNNQGLGLSIVHGLVEKYQGTINVRNLDQGCEFAISFPAAPF